MSSIAFVNEPFQFGTEEKSVLQLFKLHETNCLFSNYAAKFSIKTNIDSVTYIYFYYNEILFILLPFH